MRNSQRQKPFTRMSAAPWLGEPMDAKQPTLVIAGVPYSTQELLNLSEVSGGTSYGASTIATP